MHSLQRHLIGSHIRKLHVCLAITCHLRFWQNDRDLLRATAVTRGRKEHGNESAQNVDPAEGDDDGGVTMMITAIWMMMTVTVTLTTNDDGDGDDDEMMVMTITV